MARAKVIANSIMKWLAIVSVTVAVGLLFFVQTAQLIHRHQAAELLRDFQALRLKKSNWQDAQKLMARWGAHGNYIGRCDFDECLYGIELESPVVRFAENSREYLNTHAPRIFSGDVLVSLWQGLGGRADVIRISFLVEDGVVQRSAIGFLLSVPPKPHCGLNCYEDTLAFSARADDELSGGKSHVLGLSGAEQLAIHPFYKVGLRRHCTICTPFEVAYTPSVDPEDLKKFTSYNMSCIAGWHACSRLDEVLPAAADWHFDDEDHGSALEKQKTNAITSCIAPVFAQARDATTILLVDIDSQAIVPMSQTDDEHQLANARLVKILKGTTTLPVGTLFSVIPFYGFSMGPHYTAENMLTGNRYVIFTVEDITDDANQLPYCGVFADSPTVDAEIRRGMALNDGVRFKQPAKYPQW